MSGSKEVNGIKSNLFLAAGNNNAQYKSIELKYEIPLLKEWMVRQADMNTIANLGLRGGLAQLVATLVGSTKLLYAGPG